MLVTDRVVFKSVEGATKLFTNPFIEYLVALHDRFNGRVLELRAKRADVLNRALRKGVLPTYMPVSEINAGDWQVPAVPEELKKPGIEISGPASVTGMFINALNPGPDGTRAEGDLDDDEDSSGHQFADTVTAALNRLGAVNRTLQYRNQVTGKDYRIEDGEIPFFMHRERGLHLDEPDVHIDGTPVAAAILGTALTLFHCGRAQIERGQGVYFYLPKMESAREATFWKDFFDFSRDHLKYSDDAIIRAIPLVESLPLAYQMEETLYELGPYAAGLNAARWDFKASIFEFVMSDPDSVWPDRFGVDVKTTEFLANTFRRLVAVCLKRGAVAIGGMATALPSRNTEVNAAAAASIKADKEWEARQGFTRGWVAHIFHMKTAADPFKELIGSGWSPSPEMKDPANYPIEIQVPKGPVTVEGTRRNIRMLIEYVEGWLNGRGAKGIDSLEGQSGVHPALMEDLATGRMSVAQIAQRILHAAKDTDTGQIHNFELVKQLLSVETEDIISRLRDSIHAGDTSPSDELIQVESNYRRAAKIASQWIKNYTKLDFRSLGSYTRANLDDISSKPFAF